ncbi:MAG: Fe-S cluster-containing hydrogenase [Polyangiaceae bacterium]
MKRLPIVKKDSDTPAQLDKQGPWFQTLAERNGDPSIEEARLREFQDDHPDEPPPGVDRRTFMTLMGASMALAGMAGCSRPVENILPFSKMPEDFVPGRSEYYATAMPLYGTAVGLLVESVDGRPIKIEGNPDHPESLGATTAFIQASVLDLYDPDRSQKPRLKGADSTTEEAWKAIGDLGRDLLAKRGKGLGVLVEDTRSPTTSILLSTLMREMPEARVFRFEAFGRENQRAGLALAFGGPKFPPVDVTLDLAAADVVVALDADILGSESSPVKNSKGFAKRRRAEDTAAGKTNFSRIYVAEPVPTVTGHAADHRLRVQGRRIADVLRALATELGALGLAVGDLAAGGGKLGDKETKWVKAAAKDLATARGKSIVAVGCRQAPALHALAAAINLALGNIPSTIKLAYLMDDVEQGVGALVELAKQVKDNKIDTLLMLGGNPVFNAPGDLGFADIVKAAKTSIHLSTHVDETSQLATWHIPRAHYLESWSDARCESGILTVMQPLIAPMYGGRTDAEVIERLIGGMRSPYELVASTWEKIISDSRIVSGADLEDAFATAIHAGVHVPATRQRFVVETPVLNAPNVTAELKKLPAAGDFEVLFAPDPHAYDGRFANNSWLMELPDPIHKVTWGTAAPISYATAQKLAVSDGDHVEVTVGNKSVSVPVVVSYGAADDSITLPVGLGRKFEGRVCKGVGVDVNAVRTRDVWNLGPATVKKGSNHDKLAITQGHFVMEGRPLVRTQTVTDYKADPGWAGRVVEHPPLLNLFADWSYNGRKWGMAIDLTLCTGCSACVTACQAENNIPVVGAAAVIKSREMHWLRIDRYFAGKDGAVEGADEADAAFMPMLCQHCENAPCEQVCPVAATTHSPEGINEMTYNRCIGTKYCGNNCPFKVRRFNFFHWNKEIPESQKLVLNPEVTVRYRGVMEKCSFCVQRVNAAKIASKKAPADEREIMHGLQTACMQACPTEAITFGDLNDGSARADGRTPVAELAVAPGKARRAYNMLEEINVRPRINYLARIRNPHPDLEPPKSPSEHEGGEHKESH